MEELLKNNKTPIPITILGAKTITLKGKDGAKGEKGDKPVAGVDYPIPKDGRDGRDGESIQGQPGKDGSPDLPEQIRDKLETLKGKERLSKEAIQGLEDLIDKLALDRAISILDQRTSFLINKVNNLPTPVPSREYDNGNSGTAITLNFNNGLNGTTFEVYQSVTLTGACTFTFIAPSVTGIVKIRLKIIEDGTGSRTISWPSSTKFANNQAIILTKAANAIDYVFLIYNSATGNYDVSGLQNNVPA